MKTIRNRKGQSTLEYVMIAALVVGLALLLWNKISGPARDKIDDIANNMGSATTTH